MDMTRQYHAVAINDPGPGLRGWELETADEEIISSEAEAKKPTPTEPVVYADHADIDLEIYLGSTIPTKEI
jgi:hypothetical protein